MMHCRFLAPLSVPDQRVACSKISLQQTRAPTNDDRMDLAARVDAQKSDSAIFGKLGSRVSAPFDLLGDAEAAVV
jgi:hypothetical protein